MLLAPRLRACLGSLSLWIMTREHPAREPDEFGAIYDSLLSSLPDTDRARLNDMIARERRNQIEETQSRTPDRNDPPTAT